MTPPRSTAEEQLERILYILPIAARGAVPIDEVARALAVEPRVVLRDLEAATARAYYAPAGSVDSFTIMTDGRTVEVHAPRDFARPVRLNQGEALALELGLRALAADGDLERRAHILSFAQRLEAALGAENFVAEARVAYSMDADMSHVAEDDVEYEAMDIAFEEDSFRGVIADAIELGVLCTIWYLKPGASEPAQRSIAPHRLVHAYGMWYVLAHDLERAGVRWFRMDRILDARLEHQPAPAAPAELDAHLHRGVPYSATDEQNVRVRYSPKIARWIAERASVQLESDGSAVIEHRVADPGWIVRHVLQYGGEAVVESPDEARAWLLASAARVADVVA